MMPAFAKHPVDTRQGPADPFGDRFAAQPEVSSRVVVQQCVKPRKSNVSGLPTPRWRRFSNANRPNSTRRVLSGLPTSGAETADLIHPAIWEDFRDIERADHPNGLVSLYARDDATGSETAIVIDGLDVLGRVHDGQGNKWRLTPLGGGRTAVYRYDTSRFRKHPPGWHPGRFDGVDAVPHKQQGAPRSDSPAVSTHIGASADTGDVIDVMVVYTRSARSNVRNIDAFIQGAFDSAHRHFENSNIPLRLKLVHALETDYVQSGDIEADLLALAAPTDGKMDDVHALRDRHRADLVHLFVRYPPQPGKEIICGVAPYAHLESLAHHAGAVTDVACELTDGITFVHETGHNLGAGHDRSNAAEAPFPYGYAYCHPQRGWATVMAYAGINNRCSRNIPYFSNPSVRYEGLPTGEANRTDNSRVLRETASIVANHRQSRNTGGATGHVLPFIFAERTTGRDTFVRIVNRSARAGTVTLTAIDDAGRNAGTETLDLDAHGAIHFDSRDLERGNAAKGLSGVGAGTGHWRLVIASSLDIRPLAYARTNDGFFSRIDEVESELTGVGNRYIVHIVNPGSNRSQRSYLRLINPGSASARITITAYDDGGERRGPVSLSLPAGHARHVTASELESGQGLDGRLGTGSGRWWLMVSATRPVHVMSLLQTPAGHLANLSGVPAITDSAPASPPPTGPPDLVVQSPSVSNPSPSAGASFTLRATVRNQGAGRSAATTLRYYRSSNTTISTNDVQVGTDAVSALSASGTSVESIALRAPTTAGTYYYGACVSAVSGESSTANNCSSSVRVTVGSTSGGGNRPDLVVQSPSVSNRSPSAGASFTLRATVRNQGAGRSAATTLRYYRSSNTTISSSDVQVGTDAVSALFASGTSVESIALRAPTTAGTYYYGACVSAVSGESNTANNCSSSVRVTVGSAGGGRNRAPTIRSRIPSIELLVGRSWTFRNTSSWFADPDGDRLTITARTGSSYIAVTLSGGQLVVRALPLPSHVSVARESVRVTARDPAGLTVWQTLNVTVRRAPSTSTPPTAIFRITDACNDGRAIQYRFFQYDRWRSGDTVDGDSPSGVWPSSTRVFLSHGFNQSREHRLNCTAGKGVCFGGNRPNDRSGRYWGAGIGGDKDCSRCCVRCPTSDTIRFSGGRLICP